MKVKIINCLISVLFFLYNRMKNLRHLLNLQEIKSKINLMSLLQNAATASLRKGTPIFLLPISMRINNIPNFLTSDSG